jgi:hypothetical protein
MRTIRALTIAAALAATLPSLGPAQAGRQFKDSWFWGAKIGGFTVADSAGHFVHAPSVGLDWLITRTRGGVYISGTQTFFSQHAFTLRDPVSRDSGFRPIKLQNMRRLDVAVMGFPGKNLAFHHYAGAGFSVQQIGHAVPEGVFSNIDQLNFARAVIEDENVAISPLFMGGGQWRLHQASVFAQLMVSPAHQHFIAYNGKPWNLAYEIGVRYNIGSAIDRNDP